MKAHLSLFGIPVRFDPTFLALVFVFGYLLFLHDGDPHGVQMFVIWIPLVTAAVLVHELGHALMGRAFGLSPFILLHGMGGLTQFDARAHRALSHGRRVLITLAGPGAGVAVGVLAFVAERWAGFEVNSIPQRTLTITYWVTGFWGLLNLAPMMPLDGGHVLAIVLDRLFGPAGLRAARVVSILVALLLGAWALLAGEWFWSFLSVVLAWQNYRSYRLEKHLAEEVPVQRELAAAYEALAANDVARVRAIAQSVSGRARSTDAKAKVAHLLAWSSLLEGDAGRAMAHLASVDAKPDAYLEGCARLANDEPFAAIGPLLEALEDRREEVVADALAEAIAKAGSLEGLLELIASEPRSRTTGLPALQRVAYGLFTLGELEKAGLVYEKLHERFADPLDAFNAACAHARREDTDRALRWLANAVDAGLEDPSLLDTDEDLAPLRGRPELADLRARARA